ncbi:aminotransferase-like domain-containing protein [Pseudoroseomonas sp. WGS1072]|uniref:aminotransferase-like domain-containing protein n=1 Tax=Roseomonas sp. WGS1072 TaxID=3366816 RepID=UPI003BEF85B1
MREGPDGQPDIRPMAEFRQGGRKALSKAGRIAARLVAAMEGRQLRPGSRLASIRQGAREQGVSKNTMAEAYERLVASGHLEARRGAGYFVSGRPSRPAGLVPAARREVAEALNLVSLLREQTEEHYLVRPGEGRPPPSWMEGSELARHLTQASRALYRGEAHGYGSSWGYAPLRERIALSLAERSLPCGPEQVLLTQGANHALDLVIRHLIAPGDRVLVDDPGYYPLFAKLRLAKAEILGVRRTAAGPDVEHLAAQLARRPARAFFTQSLAHNPTGGTLTPAVAAAVLRLTERHGCLLVEDDPFADLLPAAGPRLAALDGLRQVLYVGTFSKTLSASLRVGYLAGPAPLVAALNDLKLLTVVSTSQYAERLVCRLMEAGHYRRHLRRLARRVEAATAQALRDLAAIGLPLARPPGGGFYLWARLPPGLDEEALCRRAAAQGIFLAPGAVFSPERGAGPAALRINVAHAGDPRFLDFMARALAAGA